MKKRVLSDHRVFTEGKLGKNNIFLTKTLAFDLYALRPGQEQRPHVHEGMDKVYHALEGEAIMRIGDEELTLGPGEAVLAEAGVSHGVRNAGPADAVLAVFMAPPPPHPATSRPS